MTPAFWDSSALVPLCVRQQQTSQAQALLEHFEITAWWAAPVEMRSAFERLRRMGQLAAAEYAAAGSRLMELRLTWREVQPIPGVRAQAETFLAKYPLRAADALQLAAAWTWCSGKVQQRTFISGDAQLLDAAVRVGFSVVLLQGVASLP